MNSRRPAPDLPDRPYTGSKSFWHTTASKLLQRAATSPMNSSAAAAILPVGVTPLLTGLADASAAVTLFANCVRVDFSGVSKVVIPRIASSTVPIFVGEGAPHSVVQSVFNSLVFGPANKMLFAAVLTGELQTYTGETAAETIRLALTDRAMPELDKVVFDSVAASALRPAGLLNGVSDLGPTAGGGLAALTADLAKISGAMGDAGIGSDDLFIFANPRQAVVMRGLLSPLFNRNYTIIGTPAITAGTIVGVAPRAVVTGFMGEPEIELTSNATVHLEGTTPDDITTASVATSVKSLWQANLLAVRLRIRCAWAPLAAAAVQKIVSVSW